MEHQKLLEKLNEIDELTSDMDMFLEVISDALKQYEHMNGITSICYLFELVSEKSSKIRALF